MPLNVGGCFRRATRARVVNVDSYFKRATCVSLHKIMRLFQKTNMPTCTLDYFRTATRAFKCIHLFRESYTLNSCGYFRRAAGAPQFLWLFQESCRCPSIPVVVSGELHVPLNACGCFRRATRAPEFMRLFQESYTCR